MQYLQYNVMLEMLIPSNKLLMSIIDKLQTDY